MSLTGLNSQRGVTMTIQPKKLKLPRKVTWVPILGRVPRWVPTSAGSTGGAGWRCTPPKNDQNTHFPKSMHNLHFLGH